MKISVIIVNHNTTKVLEECLKSLVLYENISELEVIVIDNASEPGSQAKLNGFNSIIPGLKVIFLNDLKSFSFANNQGIRASKGEFVLIMNPDIIFTEPVLEKLIDLLQTDGSIGAITPALTGTDGKFQRNYFQRYPTIRQYLYYHSILAKLFNRSANRMNRFLENQDIDAGSGKMYGTEQIPFAFFLTRREIFEEIGYLDDDYGLFFEDVDFSYRLSEKYTLMVDTSVRITHLGGSSFRSESTLYGRYMKSMLHFFRKFRGGFKYNILKGIVMINSYIIILIESLNSVFGKQNKHRKNKHLNMLKLLRNSN